MYTTHNTYMNPTYSMIIYRRRKQAEWEDPYLQTISVIK